MGFKQITTEGLHYRDPADSKDVLGLLQTRQWNFGFRKPAVAVVSQTVLV